MEEPDLRTRKARAARETRRCMVLNSSFTKLLDEVVVTSSDASRAVVGFIRRIATLHCRVKFTSVVT